MDETSTPDLVASTGINDPSSPWGGLLQTALTTGVSLGTDALTNALSLQTPVTAPSSSAPGQSGAPAVGAVKVAPAAASHNSLPWIIGGAIVLVLGFFFLRD